eukprot:COSAG01_NODE_451_length_16883_cov_55.881733_14_plen_360_part_00
MKRRRRGESPVAEEAAAGGTTAAAAAGELPAHQALDPGWSPAEQRGRAEELQGKIEVALLDFWRRSCEDLDAASSAELQAVMKEVEPAVLRGTKRGALPVFRGVKLGAWIAERFQADGPLEATLQELRPQYMDFWLPLEPRHRRSYGMMPLWSGTDPFGSFTKVGPFLTRLVLAVQSAKAEPYKPCPDMQLENHWDEHADFPDSFQTFFHREIGDGATPWSGRLEIRGWRLRKPGAHEATFRPKDGVFFALGTKALFAVPVPCGEMEQDRMRSERDRDSGQVFASWLHGDDFVVGPDGTESEWTELQYRRAQLYVDFLAKKGFAEEHTVELAMAGMANNHAGRSACSKVVRAPCYATGR